MAYKNHTVTLIISQACVLQSKLDQDPALPLLWLLVALSLCGRVWKIRCGSTNPGHDPLCFHLSMTEPTWRKLSNLQKTWIIGLKIECSTCRVIFISMGTQESGAEHKCQERILRQQSCLEQCLWKHIKKLFKKKSFFYLLQWTQHKQQQSLKIVHLKVRIKEFILWLFKDATVLLDIIFAQFWQVKYLKLSSYLPVLSTPHLSQNLDWVSLIFPAIFSHGFHSRTEIIQHLDNNEVQFLRSLTDLITFMFMTHLGISDHCLTFNLSYFPSNSACLIYILVGSLVCSCLYSKHKH